ncbi:MAG: hypothetical protein ABFD08_06020 [Syntrophomonas sp.]
MKYERCLLLLLCVLVLAGCGNSTRTSDVTNNSLVFTNTNWAELSANPDNFKGASVNVMGKIFIAPEKDSKGTYFQMYANPKDNAFNTIVSIADPGLNLKNGDFVSVIGKVKGKFSGENAFGAKLTIPAVIAESVKIIDGKEILAPTILKIDPNQSINQNNLIIILNSIEFAKEETRLFITIQNGTSSKASFYSFNAKAIQNGTQFEDQPKYDSNYPKVQSEILPNITSNGIVVLAPMNINEKAAQFYLEGRTDNYRLNFSPYVFNVSW